MIVTISAIICLVSVWCGCLCGKTCYVFAPAFHINEKNYPTLTPGHPDQQREESPAERVLQPPSAAAAPCPGGQS